MAVGLLGMAAKILHRSADRLIRGRRTPTGSTTRLPHSPAKMPQPTRPAIGEHRVIPVSSDSSDSAHDQPSGDVLSWPTASKTVSASRGPALFSHTRWRADSGSEQPDFDHQSGIGVSSLATNGHPTVHPDSTDHSTA